MSYNLPDRLKARDNSFAELFREAKLKREITHRAIGAYCNKSIGYLCDIEHKRRRAPDLETVRKIEEILQVADGRLVEAATRERAEIDVAALIAENQNLRAENNSLDFTVDNLRRELAQLRANLPPSNEPQ